MNRIAYMTHSYEDLRKLSKEELIREYDRVAPSTQVGLAFLRDELSRRDFEELNHEISRMTRRIQYMTAVVLLLTLVNVVAVVCALWRD